MSSVFDTYSSQDQTRPGHCLGPANPANTVPAAQRQLTPAVAALLRLLTHSAMYLGIEADLQVRNDALNPFSTIDDYSQHTFMYASAPQVTLVNIIIIYSFRASFSFLKHQDISNIKEITAS